MKSAEKEVKGAGRPVKTVEDVLPVGWQDIILDLCSKGKSDVQIRAHFCLLEGKFSHRMWYALQEREEEFRETINKGKVLCEAWWITEAQDNLKNPKFQTFLWFTNMKNRFRDSWKDKQEFDHNVNFGLKELIENVDRATKENSRPMARITSN